MKETAIGTALVTWFFIVLVGLSAIGWWAYPYFLQQETRAIRASHSYVVTQQTALSSFMSEWEKLEVERTKAHGTELEPVLRAQQAGIVRQMKERAALIPGEVQQGVTLWLRGK